ncbi:MAG TPA: BBP7 family outer membrane beta-barrel protein, partial [Gemmataceae bacterium]|nr:BBP7 family outer membrane beta-barrel protein [Gemmataceae bacterium]
FRQPAITFLHDRFATANRFYGGVLGARANAQYQAFTLSVTGKIGLGTVHEEVRIDGSSTLVGPYPAPQVTGGGFYSVGANAGKFERDKFAVVPELGVNLSVQLTTCLTCTLGYNYIYINEVLRPGDQLNARINSTLIPTGQNYGARFGPPSPGLPFNGSNYWAQGFNVGFAIGY